MNKDKLVKILDYLDESLTKLSKSYGFQPERRFLEKQYDARLQNLLDASNSDIHHLESGMKNLVIQRKRLLIDKIT